MKRLTLATLVLALVPLIAPAQDTGDYADVSAYPLSDARFEAWI